MPFFTAADGDYPHRPRKQPDPMFRLVRESAERAALSVVPAVPSQSATVPDQDCPAELEAG